MIETIGLLAAFLTTASFLPQAILVLRTRNTEGISLTMYVMFTLGIACWLIYGIALSNLPMILANGVTIILVSLILAMKARSVIAKR